MGNPKNYLKNMQGFSSMRRTVVFAIDDYGFLRIKDKEALKELKAQFFSLN
jgi:hypothetical protein